jgi:vanillate monooxygenase ferredoxin subunit
MTSNFATRDVVIRRKQIEATDICSLELVDPSGSPLPSFSAGSHVDVHTPAGHVRQYSLCNDPAETHRYLIAILRDPASRGGSAAMHELAEGETVRISDPKNHFPLAHGAGHSILVAGGIGITPILCMAERLSNAGTSFELHYCARSAERTAFAQRIRQAPFADRAQFHFDDGPQDQRLDIPALLAKPDPAKHLYVCGPTGFMNVVLDGAGKHGWSDECLHREFFSAEPVKTSGDDAFEVVVASTGAVIRVGARETVVSALAAAGIEVQTSCGEGICGTCITHVIEGVPDHRDLYLNPREQAKNDQFAPCCSRAKSARLVLDL